MGRFRGIRPWLLLPWLLPCSAFSEAPALEGGGSFKVISAYQRLRQEGLFPRSEGSETEGRLRLEGATGWRWLRLEGAGEFSVFLRNTPADARGDEARGRLERLSAKLGSGGFQIVAGRQVVGVGVAHLFPVIAQTPRRSFLFIDPEYPVSEDGVSVLWDGSLTLEARLLSRPGNRRNDFHLRAKGSKAGYDVAFTAGVADDKNTLGVEAAGNLGQSLLRGELAVFDDGGRTTGQAMVGWDHTFSSRLSGEVEVFYNDFRPDEHRSTPYRGRWYLGMRLKAELDERWRAVLLAILNLRDPSTLLHLAVTRSLGNDLEAVLGQFLSVGSREGAEFGGLFPVGPGARLGLPDLTYGLIRWYF